MLDLNLKFIACLVRAKFPMKKLLGLATAILLVPATSGFVLLGAVVLLASFTHVETGKVGLYVNFSKEVQGDELMPGSWHQHVVGDVLLFRVADLVTPVENKMLITADDSALSDFDMTIIYAINPSSVSDLWIQRSRSFHDIDNDGNVMLMHKYMQTVASNAAYMAVRQFKALEVNDKRQIIETDVRRFVNEQLHADGLGAALQVNTVQVRSMLPDQRIFDSACGKVIFTASPNAPRQAGRTHP